jgi:arabinose-5-phosphate isomerase
MEQNSTINHAFTKHACNLINIEGRAVLQLQERIGESFEAACQLMLHCTGKVVVMGMGKSGHIAGKIAATLASTGTPAFFVHAAEALHGDLGMISQKDIVLAISNSGETDEIIKLIPSLKQKGSVCISLTGNPQSTLARFAKINLDASVSQEACPLGLAPTASTTVALALGDALAISLLQVRGFNQHDFARSHPHGQLGKRLTLTVADLMISGQSLPCVSYDQVLTDVILEMTSKHLGMTTVIDKDHRVCGIITDGDLRRHWARPSHWQNVQAKALMSTAYKSIDASCMAIDALQIMQSNKITQLLILHPDQQCHGVIHIHHLLQAEIV